MPADEIALVADIGGTNTRVGLARGPKLLPETIRRFRNAEFADFEAVVAAYREAEGDPACAAACVAIAGPVRDGAGTLTNLNWTVDGASVARVERTAVLNDLQAQGHALGRIAPENLREVIGGVPGTEQSARLVIGVGTGFNTAPVYPTPGGGRVVPPAEAGHATLPARIEADLRLLTFVSQNHGYPDIEEALSGRGLENIYAWIASEAGKDARLPSAEIIAGAEAGEALSRRTLEVFVRLLARVAGDLALNAMPFGGVYVSGGMGRAMAPWFDQFGFADEFRAKGRFSGLMDQFPVFVIEDDYAALIGCAAFLDRS
ncbi:MAG: glucokinase [Pseudomonadota bacterium]